MKKIFSMGPWSLDESGWIVDREGEPVCLINAGLDYKQFSPQEKSYTHLIAAAPELYEALYIANQHAPCELYAKALAKARGEAKND